MKKLKELKEEYNEIKKDPRKKAIFFLVFYFVLFLILIIVIRISNSNANNKLNYEYEKGKEETYSLENILNENYAFTYNIKLDSSIYSYTGERNGKKAEFIFNNNTYKVEDNKYYKDSNLVDNPILFSDFIDTNKMSSLLINAYLISSTNYTTGDIDFNHQISSNTINQLLYNKITDFEEKSNTIIVTTDEDHNAYKIVYNLDSYCKLNNLCNNNLQLDIEYSRFGKIKDK